MSAAPLAILFDLDGTLIDSEPGILASCKAAVRSLGHDAAGLDLAGLIGPPLEEIMATILARVGDDRIAEGVLAYREHYGVEGFRASAPYPGVADMLAQLAASDVALYVATSKRTVFARRILEHLGLAHRFAAIYGSEPDGSVDRKSALIAHILKRHDLRPERCLMVGDRRHDVEGARANGVGCVGVLWGYGAREELEAACAAHVVARPADIIPIVERCTRG